MAADLADSWKRHYEVIHHLSVMSKSFGNIVDPHEAMKIYTSEGLRYFLLKQGVPYDDSNFNHTKALNVINSDLVNNVGNLLSRGTVTKLNPLQKYPFFDLIAMDEEINNSAQPLISELSEIRENTSHLYDQLMFYKAIEKIMGLIKQGNAFFQMHEPWKLKQGPKIKMAIEMQQIIELILAIFLPVRTSYKLKSTLHPLAIFIHGSDCNIHVAVNIILCFFFYVPAIIHALWYCFFRG
uniref:Methionine--tRNA ligase, mitochondrial n=1 Tax=Heterorhabditis bacteriophora TaxID=37862 RepID=A0A1I7XH81_HETBA